MRGKQGRAGGWGRELVGAWSCGIEGVPPAPGTASVGWDGDHGNARPLEAPVADTRGEEASFWAARCIPLPSTPS
jgi:hypothetical protein